MASSVAIVCAAGLYSLVSKLEPVQRITAWKLTLFSLPGFLLLIPALYGFGGLNILIFRTQYVGIYFVIMVVASIFSVNNRTLQRLVVALSVIIILTSASAAVVDPSFTEPPHTIDEEAAIKFSGTHVPSDEYVFSDSRMGTPLLYYEHRAVVITRVNLQNWETIMRDVFYSNSAQRGFDGIESAIESSSTETTDSQGGYYFILNKRMYTTEIRTLSFRVKAPNKDTYRKFNRHPTVNKVHSTGDQWLYRKS